MQSRACSDRSVDLPLCAPLNDSEVSLARIGGKGLNLAKLTQAGFPVPEGFVVTTDGYDAFVRHAGIADWMAEEIAKEAVSNPDALTALSQRIRARFRAGSLPPALATQIRTAYGNLGRPRVAVRSSATAEDLPDLSFAGQQDTFLNVLGEDDLLAAVVDCFGSLWSARAIGYRARNGMDQSAIALAVVVQEMVQSETSGVLFTANPLTGRRTESVIEATFGLGEPLVGGMVEPDHHVVDTRTGRVLEAKVGAKATVMQGLAAGGTETVQADRRQRALADAQIGALADLGQRVAALYGTPQDIEWAFADGRLFLLQARPITTLYPLPRPDGSEALRVYISLGAIQGVLDPFTPLGQDMIKGLFAGICRIFGLEATIFDQPLVHIAGERPWIGATGALRNPLGRRLFLKALPLVEPVVARSIHELMRDPRLPTGTLRPSTLARAAPVLARFLGSFLFAWLRPEAAQRRAQASVEKVIALAEGQAQRAGTLHQRLALWEWLCYRVMFPMIFPLFMPLIAAGYASLHALGRLAAKLETGNPDLPPGLFMEVTRGLANNATTEMDLQLWQAAQRIRADAQAYAAFSAASPESLTGAFHSGTLPPAAQTALAEFLEQYGMRGLAEIDVGRPRWREQPIALIRALQSYLSITDAQAAPDAVFRRGQEAAKEAEQLLAEAATAGLRTPLAGGLVHWLTRRVRTLAGLRESPKFLIIRLMDMARTTLLTSGRELVDAGVIDRTDDLFFLHLNELKVLAMCTSGDWRRLVQARRAAHNREMRRRTIPRLLFSDGTAIHGAPGDTAEASAGTLVGSGVSPGTVEGTVHVVFNPNDARLEPGEILVCPGTDPSWTPLFLAAGGLVMEVGGMMTHGSVVAREYGIPAVAGVDRATERLQSGQRVRVDGNSGRIQLID